MCNEKTKCHKPCVPYEEEIQVDRLARAYVPFQHYCNVMDAEKALVRGTAFEELYMPYFKKPNCCKR